MRKCFALLVLWCLPVTAIFAQDVVGNDSKPVVEKPSRDFIMLEFAYNGWTNKPDSVHTGGFGRGFNGFLCYDFPIKKSNFSFATGLGVNINNIYFDNQKLILTDTGSTAVAHFIDTGGFKKFKYTTTFLTAPFELRYFSNNINRNKGFKAAIGLRVGLMVGAHTKEKYSLGGTTVDNKVNSTRFLNKWEFTGTARVGFGNFYLFGTYNLTPLFAEGSGPQVVPFSIGIGLTGL
jgi:Outer membrane protein beta-barrel domain